MKNIRQILAIASFAVVSACTTDIEKLNVNLKAYQASVEPSGEYFISNAMKGLADRQSTTNVNSGIFRLIAQQWTQTTYTDESRYNLVTRSIPDNHWDYLYQEVLINLKEAIKLIDQDKNTANYASAAAQKATMAMADVLSVYATMVLVDTFGDVPYEQSLNLENLLPKYDDAKTIYLDLLARLDKDIRAIESGGGKSFSETQSDLIYGGDNARWKKFAGSLKLRLGMMLADVDPAVSKTAVESAVAAGVFLSNADNAIFKYLTTPPNTNPIWEDLVQTGRTDFVASETIIDLMNDLNDPRRPYYFTEVESADKGYKGGVNGRRNTYTNFSHVADKIKEEDFRGVFLDYAEVEFLLAEAIERGYVVGGSAEEHYKNAIRASITDWGGTTAEADAYLATSAVAYTTAAGDYRQKIGVQKYIALYNRGFEAWTEQRRLDFPKLKPVDDPQGPFPLRYTYPAQEQTLNLESWKEAVKKMGDNNRVDIRIFWDTQ